MQISLRLSLIARYHSLLYLTVGPNRILLIGLFAKNALGEQTYDLPNRIGKESKARSWPSHVLILEWTSFTRLVRELFQTLRYSTPNM